MHHAHFLLRQHTPMAHFQHFQTDATLRATELKPALDRYLIEKVFNNDLAAFENLLLAPDQKEAKKKSAKLLQTGERYVWSFKQRLAFDYKMRIEPMGEVEGFEKLQETKGSRGLWESQFPMLLANMGGKTEQTDLKNLTLHKGVAVTIQTRHPELLKEIKSALPNLIARQNFGNRSSKGFGSFTCIRVDEQFVEIKMPFRYHFTCDVSNMDFVTYQAPKDQKKEREGPRNELDRQKSLFTILDLFYKTLRSGINYPHKAFYFKSLLFSYVDTQLKEPWDKKTIKEKYFVGNTTTGQFDHRDYMGLSTTEKWGKIPNDNSWTETGDISKSGGEGFRFASPVIFKPVRLDENRFEVWFDFRVSTEALDRFRNTDITITKGGEGDLSLRPSPNFSLQGFFNFVFHEMDLQDLDNHVEEFDKLNLKCRQNPLYKSTLRPIFNNIYKNLETPNP